MQTTTATDDPRLSIENRREAIAYLKQLLKDAAVSQRHNKREYKDVQRFHSGALDHEPARDFRTLRGEKTSYYSDESYEITVAHEVYNWLRFRPSHFSTPEHRAKWEGRNDVELNDAFLLSRAEWYAELARKEVEDAA